MAIIPKAISRSKIIGAIETLGFDPLDLSEVTITPMKLHICVFARDKKGHHIVEDSTRAYIKNSFEIPVIP